jgi:bifunctional non-homologous end joining protein LigD
VVEMTEDIKGADVVLKEYQKKRDFEVTPEPKGNVENGKGNIFVIQEHNSSHFHWDLRLEIDGTLKSWAVPKEPPTEKGLKRLAIQVEDHPIEYANFEGVIPKGNYGAGTVSIWDNGTFVLEEMNESKLVFELKGRRIVGKYALIKVQNMGKNSWLFFKKK